MTDSAEKKRSPADNPHNTSLEATSLETRAENLLELWYVVEVHEGVVLSGDIGI